MAVCVAAEFNPLAGAQLGYGQAHESYSGETESSEQSGADACEAGLETPPPELAEPAVYVMAPPPPAQKKMFWGDWQEEEEADDPTEYVGPSTSSMESSPLTPSAFGCQWSNSNDGQSMESAQMTEYGCQWSATNSADGSWQCPAVPNGADWRHMMGPFPRRKRRFCTSYPDVGACRRGPTCAYAHAREEICANLLDIEEESQEPQAMTDEFFMYKYKTRWCPKGVQHEWHTCVYAHNYQDARRPVSIGYGARLCPYWSKKDTGAEYSQRCPLGLRCPYAHGAKEQLYHPHYFKTIVCRDLRGNANSPGKACPRGLLCAFFHSRAEKRMSVQDDVNYCQPLPAEALPHDWIVDFLSPPFLPESSRGGGYEDCGMSMAGGDMIPYGANMMQQCGMQMPYVVLMPMMPSATDSPSGDDSPSEGVMPVNGMSPSGMQPMQMQQMVFVPMDSSCNQSQLQAAHAPGADGNSS